MHIFTVTFSVQMFTLIRIIAVHICTLKCSKRIPDERSKKTQFNKIMFLIDLNFTKTLIFCIFYPITEIIEKRVFLFMSLNCHFGMRK